MVIVEISQEVEKVIYLLTDNNWDFPGSGSQVEMQIEGLNFLMVQKSLRAKSMNKRKKISDENKGRLSNNEVFGFSTVLGEKMSSIWTKMEE